MAEHTAGLPSTPGDLCDRRELQVSATVKCYRQSITLHITSYEKDKNSEFYRVPIGFTPWESRKIIKSSLVSQEQSINFYADEA